MDDFERQRLKDIARDTWWRSWEDDDFSWDALGSLLGGQPKWPWAGVYVEEDGRITFDGQHSETARLATVQDYWAADFKTMRLRGDDELIEKRLLMFDDRKVVHHFLNIKNFYYDEGKIEHIYYVSEIKDRLQHASGDNRSISEGRVFGFDGRVQLVGAVSPFVNILRKAPFLNANKSAIDALELIRNTSDNVDLYFINCLIEKTNISMDAASSIKMVGCKLMGASYFWPGDSRSDLLLSNSKFFGRVESQNGFFENVVIELSVFYEDFWFVRSNVSSRFLAIRSKFLGDCFLEELKCSLEVNISYSKFESSFRMDGARVQGAFLAKGAEFIGEFTVGPSHQLRGDSISSQFSGLVDFCNAKFCALASFDDAGFAKEADYRGGFRRVQFLSNVSWSKEAIHAISIFASARIEGALSLPWLNELSERKLLLQHTLRPARRSGEDAIQAVIEGAQTLKKALLQQGDFLRAQLYHKLELQAKALSNGTPPGERLAGRAYGALSDWGLSWHRPVLWLGVAIVLFAGIYNWIILVALGSQFGPVTLGFGLPAHPAIAAGIELSMSNALGPIKYLIGNDGPPALSAAEISFAVRFGLGLLSILQQIGSLALLFLSALALRRRFQIG